MNNPLLRAAALAAVAFLLFAATAEATVRDPLREGLERMLGEEASRSLPTASAPSPDCSEPSLEPLLVRLCEDIRRSPLSSPDPVSESFVRMLLHTPSRHVPPLPAGVGVDPLVEAMVEPLRR
ncbi:MAG: hypothetical protein IT519_00340 [Burkholderiales bacterium]|jgi:hypothetical protein|nr:hypothetical protein [Burkholderiales bacterium]